METTPAQPAHVRVVSPPGVGLSARAWLRARWAELCCALLLLIMAANLLSVLPRKTITVDEFVHIPAGYVGLRSGDFRPNNEHPPLAKLWAALPLLALGARPPANLPAEDPGQRTMNTARYFWEENADRFLAITFWARVPMIALTLILGVAIFLAARRAFGARAAVIAVALFSLEPTVLAHGRVVHTDIAAALAYFATWVALYAYARRPGWARAAGLGGALGIAFATKYSLLVLGPVVAVGLCGLFLVRAQRGQARPALLGQAALVAALALVLVNAGYGFRHQPLEAIDLDWIRAEHPARAGQIIAAIDGLSAVIPPYYLIGTYTVLGHNEGGHQAALFGNYSQDGWWYYFPVAFALKTALPFLLLTVGALAWSAWRIVARRDWRLLALVGPGALYVSLAMLSRLNIGVRHILPAFPFLFILGGVACDRLLAAAMAARRPSPREQGGARGRARRPRRVLVPAHARRRLGIAVVVVLLGWMAGEAASAYPDYLVHLNPLARGPGWQYLSDSNVEWGDDTEALAAYLQAQGELSVRAAVAGSRDTLQFFGVEYVDYFGAAPPGAPPRYVAIGASFLNGSTVPVLQGQPQPEYFAAYRYREPVAIFGKAIYLYRYLDPEAPLTAPLPPEAYRATITATRLPATLRPGESAVVTVQIRNDGEASWPPSDRGELRYQIRLGSRWFDTGGTTLVRDDGRSPLYQTLYPGERTDLRLLITAPSQPGDYLLDIDLVQEGVAWFGSRGSAHDRVLVRVR